MSATQLFYSKELELAFFESAPAWEIVRYLDNGLRNEKITRWEGFSNPIRDGGWFCDRAGQEALYKRRDDIIDIALVRIASCEDIVQDIFVRHAQSKPILPFEQIVSHSVACDDVSTYDREYEENREKASHIDTYFERLALSALHNIFTTEHDEPRFWITHLWEWLLEFGKLEHFKALFDNEFVPVSFIEEVLDNTFVCIDSRRRYAVYSACLASPRLSREPEDIDAGPDWRQHRLMSKFWKFMLISDANDQYMNNSIASNGSNFPKFEFDDVDFGLPEYGSEGYDEFANDMKCFEILLERWKPADEEIQTKGGCFFTKYSIVEELASRFSQRGVRGNNQSKHLAYVCTHVLLPVRSGLYKSFKYDDGTIDLAQKFADIDRFEFFEAAINNISVFYYKRNEIFTKWFYHALPHGLRNQYCLKLKERHKARPDLFPCEPIWTNSPQ